MVWHSGDMSVFFGANEERHDSKKLIHLSTTDEVCALRARAEIKLYILGVEAPVWLGAKTKA
jgi:hypothetical protein